MNIKRLLLGIGICALFAVSLAGNATVITIDNTDAGFSSIGFSPSTASCCVGDALGTNYLVDTMGPNGDSATWNATSDANWVAGLWKVEMNWTSYVNRANNALVTIGSGLASMTVDQTVGGGTWFDLGSYNFTTSNAIVTIDDTNSWSSRYIVADAVRFTLIQSTGAATIPNPATWTLILLAGFAAFRMQRKS